MAHWNKTRDANDLVWLNLDVEGRSVNVLTHEVLAELAGLMGALRQDASIKGLALLSGKAGGLFMVPMCANSRFLPMKLR